ncbi:hypothetical protein ZHAS_00008971 [Anopheles sinensis]|uniref:Uncharacterized protein n=1 Tax=Anopheles sinensis TaxID=74873 RepID=A0A084VTU4_ANOSI|nr:hypothetical protein ZHAS_00008971 [Anopheles sinensis]
MVRHAVAFYSERRKDFRSLRPPGQVASGANGARVGGGEYSTEREKEGRIKKEGKAGKYLDAAIRNRNRSGVGAHKLCIPKAPFGFIVQITFRLFVGRAWHGLSTFLSQSKPGESLSFPPDHHPSMVTFSPVVVSFSVPENLDNPVASSQITDVKHGAQSSHRVANRSPIRACFLETDLFSSNSQLASEGNHKWKRSKCNRISLPTPLGGFTGAGCQIHPGHSKSSKYRFFGCDRDDIVEMPEKIPTRHRHVLRRDGKTLSSSCFFVPKTDQFVGTVTQRNVIS